MTGRVLAHLAGCGEDVGRDAARAAAAANSVLMASVEPLARVE